MTVWERELTDLNHLLTPHLELSKHYKYLYKGVQCAYTPSQLALAEQSYPIIGLQKCYPYSRVLPLPNCRKVQPLILIGDNCTYLITAKEPIRFGHNGRLAAVRTALGWTLHGPDAYTSPVSHHTHLVRHGPDTSTDRYSILPKEHLWVMDQTLNPGRCSLSERPL